jgi:hypothetical protein
MIGFTSLLDRWDLVIVDTPDYVEGTPNERWEAERNDVCADVPLSPTPLGAVVHLPTLTGRVSRNLAIMVRV